MSDGLKMLAIIFITVAVLAGVVVGDKYLDMRIEVAKAEAAKAKEAEVGKLYKGITTYTDAMDKLSQAVINSRCLRLGEE